MKLIDVIHFIRRYKTDLMVFSLCVIIAFGLYLFLGKKMYRSQAEIMVKDRPSAASSASQEGSAQASNVRAETVKNELRILTSNDALMAAARQIAGPQASHKEALKIREYIGENLKAKIVGGSDVIALSFEFPDPLAARNVLRALLEQYKNHYGRSYFDESEQGNLRARMDAAQKNLNEAQDKLLAYERDNSVFDDRQLGVLNETREQLQITLNTLTNEYAYTLRKRDYIQGLMRNVPQEILFGTTEVPNEKYTRLQDRLAKATADHARQLSRENPDPRALARLEEEIKQVQALMKKEPRFIMDADEKESRINDARDALNRQLLELYPEVEAQKARMDNIRAQVTEIDEALAQSAASRGEHALLYQDMEMKRAVYEQAQADYASAMGGTVSHQFPLGVVISSPSYDASPVSPNVGSAVGWALALLVFGNCGIFMLCLAYDNTISRPWQATDAFNAPALATIDNRLSARNPQLPYFEVHKDELRNLYINLHSRNAQPQSVLFTSVEEEAEEHSPAEAFAAYALKYHNRKPVVVRYSAVGDEAFPQEAAEASLPGLPVYTRHISNLPKERILWEKLKNNCDLLVIEYAPLRQGEFLFALVENTDESVVGIAMERSDKNYVRKVMELLRQYGASAIGILLHKRRD